jgi:hypothetical protein
VAAAKGNFTTILAEHDTAKDAEMAQLLQKRDELAAALPTCKLCRDMGVVFVRTGLSSEGDTPTPDRYEACPECPNGKRAFSILAEHDTALLELNRDIRMTLPEAEAVTRAAVCRLWQLQDQPKCTRAERREAALLRRQWLAALDAECETPAFRRLVRAAREFLAGRNLCLPDGDGAL